MSVPQWSTMAQLRMIQASLPDTSIPDALPDGAGSDDVQRSNDEYEMYTMYGIQPNKETMNGHPQDADDDPSSSSDMDIAEHEQDEQRKEQRLQQRMLELELEHGRTAIDRMKADYAAAVYNNAVSQGFIRAFQGSKKLVSKMYSRKCCVPVIIALIIFAIVVAMVIVQLSHTQPPSLASLDTHPELNAYQTYLTSSSMSSIAADAVMAQRASFNDTATGVRYVVTRGIGADKRIRMDAIYPFNSSSPDWSTWGIDWHMGDRTWCHNGLPTDPSILNVPWADTNAISYSVIRGITVTDGWRLVAVSNTSLDSVGSGCTEPLPVVPYVTRVNATIRDSDFQKSDYFLDDLLSLVQTHAPNYPRTYEDYVTFRSQLALMLDVSMINLVLPTFSMCMVTEAVVTSITSGLSGVYLQTGDPALGNCTHNNDTNLTPSVLAALSAFVVGAARLHTLENLCYAGDPAWSPLCEELATCTRTRLSTVVTDGLPACTCLYNLYRKLGSATENGCGPCTSRSLVPCMCWVKALLLRNLLARWSCENMGQCLVQIVAVPAALTYTCYPGEGCGDVLSTVRYDIFRPCITAYDRFHDVPGVYRLLERS